MQSITSAPRPNRGFAAPRPHAIIACDDPRRSFRRSLRAAAGLPRQPRAGEPDRARARLEYQPAGRHRRAPPAVAPRQPAGGGERGADHTRPGAAGAVLSAAAGAVGVVRARVRPRLLGARLPALGACLLYTSDAAD